MGIMEAWRILSWIMRGELTSSKFCGGFLSLPMARDWWRISLNFNWRQDLTLRIMFCSSLLISFICIEKVKALTFISRLDRIRKATKGRAQLVLHGTNTFPDDTMKGCIKGGMTRCNVNELVLYKYNKYVAENTGKVPLTELMGKGTALIQEQIEYQMDIMGSTGKA
jgi:hypothetical protein